MSEYFKRMHIAISAAIMIPELYGFLYTQFLLCSFPIRDDLVLGIPWILVALQWFLVLLFGTLVGFEKIESFPCSLILWIIPAASMLSTMLLILHGSGTAPSLHIFGPMLVGFLMMIAGSYLPQKSLLQPQRRLGNLLIWFGGITVFISGLGTFYLYLVLAAALAILALIGASSQQSQ